MANTPDEAPRSSSKPAAPLRTEWSANQKLGLNQRRIVPSIASVSRTVIPLFDVRPRKAPWMYIPGTSRAND